MTINSAVPADVAEKQFNGGGNEDIAERDAAIQSIVDDILDGKTLLHGRSSWYFTDFLNPENIAFDDFYLLICGDAEKRESLRDQLKKRCEGSVNFWCEHEGAGVSILQTRITQLREYARESSKS